MVVVLASIV